MADFLLNGRVNIGPIVNDIVNAVDQASKKVQGIRLRLGDVDIKKAEGQIDSLRKRMAADIRVTLDIKGAQAQIASLRQQLSAVTSSASQISGFTPRGGGGNSSAAVAGLTSLGSKSATTTQQVAGLSTKVQKLNIDFRTLGGSALSAASTIGGPMARDLGVSDSLFKTLGTNLALSTIRLGLYAVAAGGIFGTVKAFEAAASEAYGLSKAMTDIEKSSLASKEQINELKDSIFTLSTSYGQSISEVATASSAFVQQGATVQQTIKGIEGAVLLSNATSIKLSDTVGSLTAIMGGFGKGVSDATSIVNNLAAVSDVSTISLDALTNVMSKIGESAAGSGASLQQVAAIIATVKETTNASANDIAIGLKNLLVNTQANEGAIQSLGIATRDLNGNFLGTFAILQSLSGVYKGLTDSQRIDLAYKLTGKKETAILNAVLTDFNRTLEIQANALETSGGAADRQAKQLETLGSRATQVASGLAKTFSTLGESGASGIAGGFIDGANTVVGLLNRITNLLGPLKVAIPAALGFYILKSAIPLLQNATAGVAAIGSKLGGAAANAREASLIMINSLESIEKEVQNLELLIAHGDQVGGFIKSLSGISTEKSVSEVKLLSSALSDLTKVALLSPGGKAAGSIQTSANIQDLKSLLANAKQVGLNAQQKLPSLLSAVQSSGQVLGVGTNPAGVGGQGPTPGGKTLDQAQQEHADNLANLSRTEGIILLQKETELALESRITLQEREKLAIDQKITAEQNQANARKALTVKLGALAVTGTLAGLASEARAYAETDGHVSTLARSFEGVTSAATSFLGTSLLISGPWGLAISAIVGGLTAVSAIFDGIKAKAQEEGNIYSSINRAIKDINDLRRESLDIEKQILATKDEQESIDLANTFAQKAAAEIKSKNDALPSNKRFINLPDSDAIREEYLNARRKGIRPDDPEFKKLRVIKFIAALDLSEFQTKFEIIKKKFQDIDSHNYLRNFKHFDVFGAQLPTEEAIPRPPISQLTNAALPLASQAASEVDKTKTSQYQLNEALVRFKELAGGEIDDVAYKTIVERLKELLGVTQTLRTPTVEFASSLRSVVLELKNIENSSGIFKLTNQFAAINDKNERFNSVKGGFKNLGSSQKQLYSLDQQEIDLTQEKSDSYKELAISGDAVASSFNKLRSIDTKEILGGPAGNINKGITELSPVSFSGAQPGTSKFDQIAARKIEQLEKLKGLQEELDKLSENDKGSGAYGEQTNLINELISASEKELGVAKEINAAYTTTAIKIQEIRNQKNAISAEVFSKEVLAIDFSKFNVRIDKDKLSNDLNASKALANLSIKDKTVQLQASVSTEAAINQLKLGARTSGVQLLPQQILGVQQAATKNASDAQIKSYIQNAAVQVKLIKDNGALDLQIQQRKYDDAILKAKKEFEVDADFQTAKLVIDQSNAAERAKLESNIDQQIAQNKIALDKSVAEAQLSLYEQNAKLLSDAFSQAVSAVSDLQQAAGQTQGQITSQLGDVKGSQQNLTQTYFDLNNAIVAYNKGLVDSKLATLNANEAAQQLTTGLSFQGQLANLSQFIAKNGSFFSSQVALTNQSESQILDLRKEFSDKSIDIYKQAISTLSSIGQAGFGLSPADLAERRLATSVGARIVANPSLAPAFSGLSGNSQLSGALLGVAQQQASLGNSTLLNILTQTGLNIQGVNVSLQSLQQALVSETQNNGAILQNIAQLNTQGVAQARSAFTNAQKQLENSKDQLSNLQGLEALQQQQLADASNNATLIGNKLIDAQTAILNIPIPIVQSINEAQAAIVGAINGSGGGSGGGGSSGSAGGGLGDLFSGGFSSGVSSLLGSGLSSLFGFSGSGSSATSSGSHDITGFGYSGGRDTYGGGQTAPITDAELLRMLTDPNAPYTVNDPSSAVRSLTQNDPYTINSGYGGVNGSGAGAYDLTGQYASGNLSDREISGLIAAASREKSQMPGNARLAVANTSEKIITSSQSNRIGNFAGGSGGGSESLNIKLEISGQKTVSVQGIDQLVDNLSDAVAKQLGSAATKDEVAAINNILQNSVVKRLRARGLIRGAV